MEKNHVKSFDRMHSIGFKVHVSNKKMRLKLSSDGSYQAKENRNPPKENRYVTTKEIQITNTLKWLEDNFIRCTGVCLPRCIMYAHYLTFCHDNKYRPACAATFGKIIRQKFPEITTRRLGTRGNSKYHYYGVAIKETSEYYHTVYSGVGLTRFSESKLLDENGISKKIINSTQSGTLLPDFPSPHQLKLPFHVEMSKMETLMIMYRTHCQCILDTAVAKNYEGIRQYLIHFWNGIPKHLKSLFDVEEVVTLICICDSIMYMVLNDILVPESLDGITDVSLSEVRRFVDDFEKLLQDGLQKANPGIMERKLEVARRFTLAVKRQISFLHLAKSFREVLSDSIIAKNLLTELDSMDIKSIGVQALYTTFDCNEDQADLHTKYLGELRELLRHEASVESYINWLEEIFKNQVMKQADSNFEKFKLQAQQFLLSWSFFGTRLMNMLTLNNSRTYGPFHLIRMMLDEYLLLITETRINQQAQIDLQNLLEKLHKGNTSNLKISKIITKSKFGEPSQKSNQSKVINFKGNVTVPLPPISTIHLPQSILNINTLPNDSFNKSYGEMPLTPPSSPLDIQNDNMQTLDLNKNQGISNINYGNSKKTKNENQRIIISESVENLVDEHFRNCGINDFNVKSNDELPDILQKYFDGQRDVEYPYGLSESNEESDDNENENNVSPLQSSFSQILNSDVLFSESTNFSSTKSNDQGFESPLIFNYNFENNMAFMESLTEQSIDPCLFNGDEGDLPFETES